MILVPSDESGTEAQAGNHSRLTLTLSVFCQGALKGAKFLHAADWKHPQASISHETFITLCLYFSAA